MTDLLPTKEQIAAIDDIAAIFALKDEVERAIVHIEAQLEFLDRDEDWAKRATDALSLHRYTDQLLGRRAVQLGKRRRIDNAVRRERAESSPLTLKVLARAPDIDAGQIDTLAVCEERLKFVVDRINATQSDRDDEIARKAGDRDEAFLSATGSVLRVMRGQRNALERRRGDLRKLEAKAANAVIALRREAAFVDAAREVLDRQTFLRIWALVDQIEPQDQAAA